MKTQIAIVQGAWYNHNLGGLKVKPQTVAGTRMNHSLGALVVKR